jgi:hypothetical protein
MYQQQLLHLASAFGWIPGDDEAPQSQDQLPDDDCEEPTSSLTICHGKRKYLGLIMNS